MRPDVVLSIALLRSTWVKYRRPGRQVQDGSFVFCAGDNMMIAKPVDKITDSISRLHQACSLGSECDFEAHCTNLQRDVAAQVDTCMCIVEGRSASRKMVPAFFELNLQQVKTHLCAHENAWAIRYRLCMLFFAATPFMRLRRRHQRLQVSLSVLQPHAAAFSVYVRPERWAGPWSLPCNPALRGRQAGARIDRRGSSSVQTRQERHNH